MNDPNGSPSTVRVNGRLQPHRPCAVADLLQGLGLGPDSRGIAVAVNGEIVSRGDWQGREVLPGDEVEVVGAVQGG